MAYCSGPILILIDTRRAYWPSLIHVLILTTGSTTSLPNLSFLYNPSRQNHIVSKYFICDDLYVHKTNFRVVTMTWRWNVDGFAAANQYVDIDTKHGTSCPAVLLLERYYIAQTGDSITTGRPQYMLFRTHVRRIMFMLITGGDPERNNMSPFRKINFF